MECRDTKPNVLNAACPSRAVLDLIADKWTVLVIYALDGGVKRYSEIQRMISGITQKVLTATLRKLEQNGLVSRAVYPVVPPKVEYKLTSLGRSLTEILIVLTHWAEKHLDEVQKARKQCKAVTQK